MAVMSKESKDTTADGAGEASGRFLKVRLVRSLIGRPEEQRRVVRGLGLRKLNSEVIRKDCPETRGMVRKVVHLVEVDVVEKR